MVSVYIHIPYCVSKCAYCDFYSKGGYTHVPQEYVSALLREIKQHNITNAATIYFGGGTPSLLSPLQVKQIISACSAKKNAEITIEANPDTVTLEQMKGFYDAGVNRVSVGVQTALDESLIRLGRKHTSKAAEAAFEIIRKSGFKNISGDIMLGLPFYSINELDATLELLENGGVTHISSYILKIEERTAFGIHPPKGLPDDDDTSDFYLHAVNRFAEKGFIQYEISNFAKKGYESRHNLAYWNCDDYIGIGAAAHSCMNKKRFFYKPDVKEFIETTSVVSDGECTSNDFIMLSLRLSKGLDFKSLQDKFNTQLSKKQMDFLVKCESSGYAKISQNSIQLTPSGMLIQNSILAELL